MTRTTPASSDPQVGRLGFTLVLVSVVAFSTAGLFTKGVAAAPWDIIFWRGLFAAGFTAAWIAARGQSAQNFLAMGWSGLGAALVGALGTAAFISAFKLTSVAHVALIYALSPLLAALIAWVWIGERPTRRLLVACLLALAGSAVMVGASFGGASSAGDAYGGLSLRGDALALVMALAMAVLMVIYRRYPKTPAAGPAALSSLVLLPPGLMWGAPFALGLSDMAILAAFGLLFALASVTLAEGAKRLPSGHTALLSSLETPLAPLLAFFVLAEVPTRATLIGGSLIVVAIIASARRSPRQTAAGSSA